MMNRETSIRTSDTVIVTDRPRRRRMVIIAAVLVAVIAAVAIAMMMRGGSEPSAPGGPGAGQVPTVTVIVPGRSQVGRTIVASGPLAARRDQPVGIAGSGGRVVRV